MMKLFLIINVLLVYAATVSQAQTPYVTKHLPKDYKGGYQSWGVAQDKTGMIYVGDNFGILQYDGKKWSKFPIKNKGFVFAIGYYNDTLFVGSDNELGYLGYDSTGQNRKYVSLMPSIPKEQKKFKTIRNITPLDKGVAFIDWFKNTLIYQNGKFTYVSPNDSTIYNKEQFAPIAKIRKQVFHFNNQVYVQAGNSLFVWNGKKLTKTNQLQGVKNLSNIWHITNYSQDTLVAFDAKAHQMRWLYLKNGKFQREEAFETELDSTFAKLDIIATVYYVKVLNNGSIALTIKNKGLYILGKDGKIQRFVASNRDTPTLWIYNFDFDKEGNIWTLGEKGIGQIHNNSSFTYWDKRHGFSGQILRMTYHNQTLYVGTMNGLSFLNKKGRFEEVKGIKDGVWDFLEHQGKFYLAHTAAIYEMKNGKPKKLIDQNYVQCLIALKNDPSKLLIGTYNQGLFLMTQEKGKWIKKKVKGEKITAKIYSIIEDKDESLWIHDFQLGIFRVWLNAAKDSVVKQVVYTAKNGLPSTTGNIVFRLQNDQLIFGTTDGIYALDRAKKRFHPHPVLHPLTKGKQTYYIYETKKGDLFIQIKKPDEVKLIMLKATPDKGYTLVEKPFRAIQHSLDSESIIELEDGRVAIAKDQTMIVYDGQWKKSSPSTYQTIIRKVFINNDSLLFTENNLRPVSLDYRFNTLRFDYASLFYEHSNKNQYQFRLKGFQEKWSKWSTERNTNYTNLPEGNYVFEVKAKNAHGDLSQVARFKFKIYPPWHRTWWAYTLYVVCAILFVLIVLRINASRLLKQKASLEKKVQQRTVELQHKQEEIMVQHEELQQQHEEITAQRDFIEQKNQQLYQKNLQVKKSIEAAKLIQDAILPFNDRMQGIFKNYFVLFRPRDIVSGDFYWADKTKDGKDVRLVAAIDCTGHGVPGAFMSMMSYTLMNEIVHQKNIIQPAQILETLKFELKHALQREKTGNQSGMDMALCNIQYLPDGAVKVIFGGAKRPMYYIKSSTQEFGEVKGSRISIGIVPRNHQVFEEHTLTLHRDDLIFLTTDGYGDQNNAARKSFGSQKLKKLLAEHALKPMAEQQQILEKNLDEHMNNTTQRDDILVMGIKL
ncbi:SpoIIE family protein phosphatase [uncultured Microscilla sp.]|uniref:SpoIIE family protein phosphatase n=1 Tax=uncultured Microscilla sp. TaxID=432653 RepID=UPI0026139093|nr:SpoIIE family protein phosphatase [uncultured Microscilla sp.]